jgi:glycosyltransferase involved in cell wall biosynthesis
MSLVDEVDRRKPLELDAYISRREIPARSLITMFESPTPSQPQPEHNEQSALYGAEYYKHSCGPIPYERNSHWLNFFAGIAEEIIRCLRPKRVFDAGCAWGFLVESFCDRGVVARGIDLSEYAIGNVRLDMRVHCCVGSLTEPIGDGPYDLVTCIEVLEHMAEEEARQAIHQMTQVTNSILFSSTPDDFNEPTHVNVHPVISWLKMFGEYQFYPDLLFDASFIAPHAFLVRRCIDTTPEDVLLLFSETLRMRGHRAAFLARHGRIEQLEGEVAVLKRQIEEASLNLAGLVETNREMKGFVDALSMERERWSRGEAELIKLREQFNVAHQRVVRTEKDLQNAQEANESARQQSAQHAAELQYRLEDSKLQTVRSESIIDEWVAHSADLSQNLEQISRRYEALQAELESLHMSPGWHLILRYRDWLGSSRVRRTWVRRFWEPSVLWALHRMKLGPKSNIRRLSPALLASGSNQASLIVPRSVAAPAPNPTFSTGIPEGSDYDTWIRENEPDGVQLEIQRRMSACFSYGPKISVLIPVDKVPIAILRDTIDSVIAQTYDNWELCIAVGGDENHEIGIYLEQAAARDPRIHIKALAFNEGISGNSNQALSLATGEYLALLDHDDTLAPFALFEVVQLLNQDRTVNFIYSDKDQITADGKRRLLPLFKPKWSPEVMLNANYLTHLCVMRTDHVREIGGWRKETDGAQDWDLFLRLIDRFGSVQHLPKVLYHWRQIGTSVASVGLQAKPYAAQAQVYCVKAHLEAIGLKDADVYHAEEGLRIAWPVQSGDRVSILYLSLTPSSETLTRATKLAEQTKHPNFEILVPLAGEASQAGPVRCVTAPANASLLDRIELAVRSASGQTLVFFDECVTPTGSDWLTEMAGPLQLPEIGIVGARLLDPHTRVLRHCGVVFTADGRLEHIYAGQPEHVSEQAGCAGWYRNWTAVSGACFAIRRDIWDAVGGMDGDILYPRLDIHLNLKVRLKTDWRILYNPYARFLQSQESALESPLLGDSRRAMDYIRTCFPNGDPHFNPSLDCRNGKVTYRPRQRKSTTARCSDYSSESEVLVEIYDFVPAQVERANRINAKPASGRLESITWFLPDFVNAFYGGVHTILRFADVFLRTYNVRSQFCVLGNAPESRLRGQVATAFPDLAASCRFFALDGHGQVDKLPASDAAVCSLWTTAYAALEFDKTRRKFYFIQDDEALFYPAGSVSALVEATYGFGFRGICNTVSLLDSYIARGGQGEYFWPCIDTNVFNTRHRKPANGSSPYTVFFYGRPGHPRNCFELLTAALRILRQRMGDRLLLISAGADWDPRDYRLDGIVHNLGLLNYQSTGALYRMCDAGVVMMMTRHLSYLPMELMGCGSLVITNRNPDSAWLLKDGENCLLADLSPSSLADRIEEGLKDVSLRRRITATAGDLVQKSYSSWGNEIEKIYRYMLSVC